MENDNEVQVDTETEGADEAENLDTELPEETTDWKAEAVKARRIASRLRTKLTKATEVKKPEPTTQEPSKPDESALVQKLERMAMRTAGITHPDDVELARSTAKKWGVDIDEVIEDEDFKVKLERQQTTRQNAEATSNIRGSGNASQVKNTPEYWIAKGTPPTPQDIPDRKARATIVRKMMENARTGGKKFYND